MTEKGSAKSPRRGPARASRAVWGSLRKVWWRAGLLSERFRPSSWSLATAVVASATAVTVVVCGVTSLLTKLLFDRWRPWLAPADTLQVTDVVKLALALAAGLAGVQALVVAYRRQRDSEIDDSRFVTRFESAAKQLGDTEPAVRIAGVQAMANLADAWQMGRQQCVDVLCGYLRLPLPLDTGLVPAEGQVREAVSRAIAQRLHRHASPSWSDLKFDLTGAHIFKLDLAGAILGEDLILNEATFHGPTRIRDQSVFMGDVEMWDCTFKGQLIVGDLDEIGNPMPAAIFGEGLRLDGATFEAGISMVRPLFGGRVSFIRTYITNMFNITGGRFDETVTFAEAYINSDDTILSMCEYRSAVIFRETTVTGSLHMPFSDFHGPVNFGFASVGTLRADQDEVLFRSHLYKPDEVEWGPIPERRTVEQDRSEGLHANPDPTNIPAGAVGWFADE